MKPIRSSLVAVPVLVASSGCTSTDGADAGDPSASSRAARPGPVFEVGAAFPTLALPALEDGRPSSVADYRGKKVILHVFASW